MPLNLLFLSPYPPAESAIANHSFELVHAFNKGSAIHPQVLAVGSAASKYGKEVIAQFNPRHWFSHLAAAELINASNADLLVVQHSFELYGGHHGAHLLDILERVDLPYVVIFHYLPPIPQPGQREIVSELCENSAGVIVLSSHAHYVLEQAYAITANVHQLPRGVSDCTAEDRDRLKSTTGLAGRPLLCTHQPQPENGIEYGIRAVAALLPQYPNLCYLVLGRPHPQHTAYYQSLMALCRRLGVQHNVQFIRRSMDTREIQHFMQMSDIYLSPCLSTRVGLCASLALAIGCGRVAVSTPYTYAQELLAEARGLLAHFNDPASIASCVSILLQNPGLKAHMEQNALSYSKAIAWSRVAPWYKDCFVGTHHRLYHRF